MVEHADHRQHKLMMERTWLDGIMLSIVVQSEDDSIAALAESHTHLCMPIALSTLQAVVALI